MKSEDFADEALREEEGVRGGQSAAGMFDDITELSVETVSDSEFLPGSSFLTFHPDSSLISHPSSLYHTNSSLFVLRSSQKKIFPISSSLIKTLDISQQRREQAMRLRREDDRCRCVAAYLLLKEALSRGYGIGGNPEFGYHEGGKPFLKDYPDIHFSMSHCRSAVACAVGRVPVGIDIETIRPYNPELARRVLDDDQLRHVETAARPDVEFIRLWTMKESLLKMTGEGIRSDLRKVDLSAGCFSTVTDREENYICTVCRRRETKE